MNTMPLENRAVGRPHFVAPNETWEVSLQHKLFLHANYVEEPGIILL